MALSLPRQGLVTADSASSLQQPGSRLPRRDSSATGSTAAGTSAADSPDRGTPDRAAVNTAPICRQIVGQSVGQAEGQATGRSVGRSEGQSVGTPKEFSDLVKNLTASQLIPRAAPSPPRRGVGSGPSGPRTPEAEPLRPGAPAPSAAARLLRAGTSAPGTRLSVALPSPAARRRRRSPPPRQLQHTGHQAIGRPHLASMARRPRQPTQPSQNKTHHLQWIINSHNHKKVKEEAPADQIITMTQLAPRNSTIPPRRGARNTPKTSRDKIKS